MNADGKTAALARLKSAEWLQSEGLQAVFRLLDGAGGKTRAVGGAVRDTLLGLTTDRDEVDLSTEFTPDEVLQRAQDAGFACIPTGAEFGTVTVLAGGRSFEVTTLREDVETDGRHAVVRFGHDWRRDAERRDFTMNALYSDPEGDLFDPLDGLEDCLAQRVRFIGDPAERIAEDRLRVFRFFRFSASHGGEHFDADGLAAVTHVVGLDQLSAERVGAEMTRLLTLRSCSRTLEVMASCGVLAFPRALIEELKRYEAKTEEPSLEGRLAVIGGGLGFERLQEMWRLSRAQVRAAQEIWTASGDLAEGLPAQAKYRHPEHVFAALPVAAARKAWDRAATEAIRQRLTALKADPMPISAKDLIARGMSPGPELGATFQKLEQAWIDSAFSLSRDDLLRRIES